MKSGLPLLLWASLGPCLASSESWHHHPAPNYHYANLGNQQDSAAQTFLCDTSDTVSPSTRAHWMRRARSALSELTGSPCPFGAFGTAIVNHTAQTSDGLGELICIGANQVAETGNPTLHGEIAAINNCTAVLSSKPYNLSPAEITTAFRDLSLYTTAEACSMCASAIGWAGFREYIYATSIWRLIDLKWSQAYIGSREVLARGPERDRIRIVGGVLEEETDELFRWQFDGGKCPVGCEREGDRGCSAILRTS